MAYKLYYGFDKFNDYEKAKRDNNIRSVPDGCRKHYGEDLDGCSTQQNEGCGKPTSDFEYRELKAKADKWDMIQWAMDEQQDFIKLDGPYGGRTSLTDEAIKELEQLYKEREQNENTV